MYIEFVKRSGGYNTDVSHVATAGQTIKMTEIETENIRSYFYFSDLNINTEKKYSKNGDRKQQQR